VVRWANASPIVYVYLKTPRFPFKVLIALHISDVVEILFHLLTEAYVETVQVCEASNSEIKMQDMVLVGGKQLSQESSLRDKISMLGKALFVKVGRPCRRSWHQKVR
jgi:hypothetical protein